jgi:hypothetical protein
MTFVVHVEPVIDVKRDCWCRGEAHTPSCKPATYTNTGWQVNITCDGKNVAWGSIFSPRYLRMRRRKGVGKNIPYIYAVGTSESFRGLGLCKRVLHELHTIAQREYRCDQVRLDATTMGKPVYERVGYVVDQRPNGEGWWYSGTPMTITFAKED